MIETYIMSKKEIDDYFVSIIPMLNTITEGIKYKQNKQHLTRDLIINESYLHVIKNEASIKEEKDIEKIAVQFIKMNIGWTNSQINKQESVNNNYQESIEDDDDDFSKDRPTTKNVLIDDFDEELEYKLELERWYNQKKCTLAEYREQEKNKEKQIIFDCYFKKGITTGVGLAKHLGINKDYGCKYYKQMKEDIREFANKYNK